MMIAAALDLEAMVEQLLAQCPRPEASHVRQLWRRASRDPFAPRTRIRQVREQQRSAGTQHAPQLGQRLADIRHVLEHARADDGAKKIIGIIQAPGVFQASVVHRGCLVQRAVFVGVAKIGAVQFGFVTKVGAHELRRGAVTAAPVEHALRSDESGPGSLDEDYLILSTIHSAKGQEWSAVSVLNVVDGCIPSDMATGYAAEIEEERRLLYVAMTRARHHLHLLVPQRFYVTQQSAYGDRHLYAAISRFLPEAIRDRFVHLGPDATAPVPEPAVPVMAPVDIAARVRAAWR